MLTHDNHPLQHTASQQGQMVSGQSVPHCNAASAFNSTLASPATGALDGRFYCASLESGTDKIFAHHYQYIYSLHLQHLHDHPVRFLEIGLGCGMAYGAGKSVQVSWEHLLMSVPQGLVVLSHAFKFLAY